MKSALHGILMASVLSALAGCSSMMNTGSEELSCSVATQGRCMSMRQAWEASNDYRPEEGLRGGRGTGKTSGQITPFLPEPVPNMAAIDEPKPLLMPTQVLRVWVNAYEDANGNLVYPTSVFSEVTPRRWNVGYSAVQAIESSRTVTPLVVDQPDTSAQAEPDAAPETPRVEGSDAKATAADESASAPGTTPATVPDSLPAGVLPPLQ